MERVLSDLILCDMHQPHPVEVALTLADNSWQQTSLFSCFFGSFYIPNPTTFPMWSRTILVSLKMPLLLLVSRTCLKMTELQF